MIERASSDAPGRFGRLFGRRRPASAAAGRDRPDMRWRRALRRRVLVAATLFAVWTAAIEARLVYLQILQHAELSSRAERQQQRTTAAPAKRGEILDRRGRVLAYSVDADSIYAVPAEIEDARVVTERLCDALRSCSGDDRRTLRARLGGQKAFAWVARQVAPDVARRVAELELDGVGFLKESRRYYPKKELAAHLLGFVGIDNVGLAGIEATYDSQIRGRDGQILIQADARRHAVFSRVERAPTAGADLELTIDQSIQHVAERELRAAVDENRAAGGSIVVVDPQTGHILALANWPTFNPNAFGRASGEARRNRAVQDLYEPGSTFKIVTASAALEERVVQPLDVIDTSPGVIRFGARQIEDTHDYGALSFTDVIVKSSNVGAIKVGLSIGAERMDRYARRFGFGAPLSRDFPGESPGIVWNPTRLDDSALASVSMGYQVGVTALQMAAAVSAVANGGTLIEPRAVRAVILDGRRVEIPPSDLRRVIERQTAETLTSIMEMVVERGTATAARIPGYQVAGKTGTSQKLVGGSYSSSDYNASFVGFVPSRKPALAVVVVIDSPHGRGYYGGVVAAPVFKRVAEAALRHLGIPPSINPVPPVLVSSGDAVAVTPVRQPVRTPALLARVEGPPAGPGLMPDLSGLGAREALRTLAELGLVVRVHGRGVVNAQEPVAGAPLERGGSATLWLARRPAIGPGS